MSQVPILDHRLKIEGNFSNEETQAEEGVPSVCI